MIKNYREALLAAFVATATWSVLLYVLMIGGLASPFPPGALVVAIPAFVSIVLGLALLFGAGEEVPKVDVWQMQDRLMAISGQRRPPTPTLTADAVMYFALVLEEVSEAAATLSRILARTEDEGVRALGHQIHAAGSRLSTASTALRLQIRDVRDRMPDRSLNLAEATSLLDDITDITVVSAGFSIAAGFPGAEGYEMVQRSNASKADPATGVIRKTADGKWIKGPNYAPPDFSRLLQRRWLDEDEA